MEHGSTRHAAMALSSLAAALLAACGGGGDGGGAVEPPVSSPVGCVALREEISWYRDTLSSEWNDVVIDEQQHIWLAGWSNGVVGQTNIEPAGNSRAVVRRLDADGSLLWDAGARFDTPGADAAEALAIGRDGTVFVVGRTTGNLDGADNAGQFDTFVAWAERPALATPWRTFQIGTDRPQHPRRAAVDARGNLLIAGHDDEYVPTNYVEAWSDAFAMRLDRQGAGTADDRLTAAWTHRSNSAEPDIGGGVASLETADGAATFVSGAVQSGTQRGMYLRRLDGLGQAMWTTRYSAVPLDHVAVIRPLVGGDLLIGGSVYGSFPGAVGLGQQDVFVARVSAADGRVLRSWQLGSSGAEWLADLQIDREGNIVLFGETTGSVVAGQPNAGGNDLFMMKIAGNDGRVLATRQWGTADDERAGHVALDQCGRAVAVGSSGDRYRRDAIAWYWRPS